MRSIPSEADWRSEIWCLDAEQAYKDLAGKSHDETVELFEQDSMWYEEDVMHMPFACFPFYANAYISYLRSKLACGDAEGASCFFGLVDARMDDIAQSDVSFVNRIMETVMYLSKNQDWYDADKSIFGSFAARAKPLVAKLQSISN